MFFDLPQLPITSTTYLFLTFALTNFLVKKHQKKFGFVREKMTQRSRFLGFSTFSNDFCIFGKCQVKLDL